MYTEAGKRATMKYQREKMDQIAIRIPKGKREVYKQHADRVGKPLYKLICDLIEEDMKRFDNQEPEIAQTGDPLPVPETDPSYGPDEELPPFDL